MAPFLRFLRGPAAISGGSGSGPSGPPPTGFSPLDYGSDLALWVKAVAGEVTLVGANVNSWDDRSPLNVHGAMNLTSSPPQWMASDADYSGHASLRLTRENDTGIAFNAAGGAVGAGPFTMCVACKWSLVNQRQYLFRMGSSTYVGLLRTAENQLAVICEDSVGHFEEHRTASWDLAPHVLTMVVTPATWSGSTRLTPGSFKVYDGSNELAFAGSAFDYNGALNSLVFGQYNNDQHVMTGSLSEAVLIKRALTAPQVAALAAFVGADKAIGAPVVQPPVVDIGAPRDAASIFMSGHSLCNRPLGAFVQTIAASLGRTCQHQQQMVPGSTIWARNVGSGNPLNTATWNGWADGESRTGGQINALAEIRNPATISGRYDHLILCENHHSLTTLRYSEGLRAARAYYETFMAANPGGVVYYWDAWEWFRNPDNLTPWINVARQQLRVWESVVSRINDTLSNIGNRTDRLAMLPAGGALAELLERATTSNVLGITLGSTRATLYSLIQDESSVYPDGSVHPLDLGWYYLACVAYAAIYRRSPAGAATVPGVTSQQAASLQGIAWSYISNYYNGLPRAPQHPTSERISIANTYATTVTAYGGTPAEAAGYQQFFSQQNSNNPLYWSVSADAPAGGWWPFPT